MMANCLKRGGVCGAGSSSQAGLGREAKIGGVRGRQGNSSPKASLKGFF
ncbi:hypothetical protein [Campylobacter upsaliensis]|nr:hypothetical protein [Campylobacter upsaliensis]MCR2101559.1 hypothetical protein [Campylobacter upsaliensis]